MAPNTVPSSPPRPPSIEDLVEGNAGVHTEDVVNARAFPPDPAATDKLREDEERLDQLRELAELEDGSTIAARDVVVRGDAVHFTVIDEDGVPSRGFFPLEALRASSTRKAKKAAAKGQAPKDDRVDTRGGAVPHGTADQGDGKDDEGGDDDPSAEVPEGVPSDIAEKNGGDVATLILNPPDGVQPAAVWEWEKANHETPRVAVQRAAKSADLAEDSA